MTNGEAVNWIINISADIGKAEHRDLWHYEQALSEIKEMLESQPERKTGQWIWNENGMDWGLGAWCCSECGSKPETWWESDKRNNPLRCAGGRFCGNCGADMKQRDDER